MIKQSSVEEPLAQIFNNLSECPSNVSFSSTYLYEAGFSTLVFIKNKYRNRMSVENDMRCALSEISKD